MYKLIVEIKQIHSTLHSEKKYKYKNPTATFYSPQIKIYFSANAHIILFHIVFVPYRSYPDRLQGLLYIYRLEKEMRERESENVRERERESEKESEWLSI